MNIKLEKLSQKSDVQVLEQMLLTRTNESDYFEVNLEYVEHINLAMFNALIKLYMKFIRRGQQLQYTGCQSVQLHALISKTRFQNVFNL